jgi:hypothetical protein
MVFYQVILLSPLQCTRIVEICKRLREFKKISRRLREFEEIHKRLCEFEDIEISKQSCRGDCE